MTILTPHVNTCQPWNILVPKESEHDQILHMRISSTLLERIDEWRDKAGPVRPSQSDAVRYLLEIALRAEGKKR